MQDTHQTYHLETTHPELIKIANELKGDSTIETAKNCYYYVRDGWLYNPFDLDISNNGLKASNLLSKKRAWCVEKAILLSTLLRIHHIPANLGFGIVVNHIGTEKLEADLKRKEIVFHGFSEVLLEDKWIKLTPAFDKRICKLSKVEPMEFSSEKDVLFQEYENGQRFMEYTHYYGVFDHVPVYLMNSEMKKYYPHLFDKTYKSSFLKFNFEEMFTTNK